MAPSNSPTDNNPVDIDGSMAAQQHIETAAQNRRARFDEFVALLPQPVFECNVQGRIVYTNPCGQETFGYSAEEFERGIPAINLVVPEDRERAARAIRSALTGNPTGNPFTALCKNGRTFPIVVHAAPVVVDGNPVGLRGLIVDLTEQKLAEERYRTIFDLGGNGLLIIENNTTIATCNQAFERLAECPRGELEGTLSWLQFVADPKERALLLEYHRKSRIDPQSVPTSYEFQFLSRQGKLRQVRVNVVMLPGLRQSLAAFTDVTEQYLAAKTLRGSETLYRAVFENTGNATILIEEDTTILVANSEWVRLSQYSKTELEGKMSWAEFVSPEDRERLKAYHCARRQDENSAPWTYEFHFVRRDGSVAEMVCHVAMIPGTKQSVASLTDVTRRKRAELERNQLQERLSQAAKLEAIGQLAGGVAHDFNNQLSAILGYAELLETSVQDPDLKEYAHLIAKASLRSADLTKQLLAFARKGKLLSVPVDIHKVLADVVSLLKRSIDPRITIVEHHNTSRSSIIGDPSQLQSAFTNLALNARDAMREGGTLSFSTSLQQLDAEYCRDQPHDITPGEFIRIDVQDSGTGMDMETRRRLFEPFFTTKTQGKGTGLGLASVYGTIKQHRGSIHVYSEVGKGSCFSVFLPLSEQPVTQSSALPASRPLGYSARVLVVDDESLVARGIAATLEKLGLTVDIRHDGVEAVAHYAEHWQNTDLVIMDLVMPQMGGKDAFRAMRLQNPNVKVIIASGFSVEGEAQQLLDEGAKGFLQKPFQASTLAELVNKVLKSG